MFELVNVMPGVTAASSSISAARTSNVAGIYAGVGRQYDARRHHGQWPVQQRRLCFHQYQSDLVGEMRVVVAPADAEMDAASDRFRS
jgi:hypothetical protein